MSLKTQIKRLAPEWLWSRLHELRARSLMRQYREEIARFSPRVVRHAYNGIPLDLWIADAMAESWYDRDWPPLQEVAFLQHYGLQKGARVFDLGAHQSVLALVLADVVGPEGHVISVEANPHNAAVGSKNRELNHASHLTVIHAAVAERSGRIAFNEMLNGKVDDGGSFGRIEVDAISIDDLMAAHGRPDVIYLDVEGYECYALRGASRAISEGCHFMIEVHVGCGLEEQGGGAAAVVAFFDPQKYELFMATGVAGGVATDAGEFTPLQLDDATLRGRFFLAAIPR